MNLGKITLVTVLVVSFIEATAGSSSGAVVFWLTLFSAAILRDADRPRMDQDRRFM